MIEVTVDYIDGVEFLKGIRILKPDDIVKGVPVHRIQGYYESAEFIKGMKALGLRKVGYDFPYATDLYAQFPISYIRFKITEFLLKGYWWIIKWLYDNARLFKRIPENQRFSWRYFTPYVWYRGIRNNSGSKKFRGKKEGELNK